MQQTTAATTSIRTGRGAILKTWTDIDTTAPENDAPCEYIIQVTCRGWYKPEEGRHGFTPDNNEPPMAKVVSWRPWDENNNKTEKI